MNIDEFYFCWFVYIGFVYLWKPMDGCFEIPIKKWLNALDMIYFFDSLSRNGRSPIKVKMGIWRKKSNSILWKQLCFIVVYCELLRKKGTVVFPMIYCLKKETIGFIVNCWKKDHLCFLWFIVEKKEKLYSLWIVLLTRKRKR